MQEGGCRILLIPGRSDGTNDGNKVSFNSFRCPKCGEEIGNKIDYKLKIIELANTRNADTKGIIAKIIKEISKYHIITERDIYYFMLRIQPVDDKIVNKIIKDFYSEKRFAKKGISYLGAIIRNYCDNIDKIMTVEKQIHGSRPPIIKDIKNGI